MDEKIRQEFAKNLKKYMDANGQKQIDLSRHLGVSTGIVSNWCSGKKIPRIDKINAIAEWLGIDFALLTGEREPTEIETINNTYSTLNDEGKKRLIEYLQLLALDPRNTKKD